MSSLKGKKVLLVSNTSWSIYNFRLCVIRHLQELGVKVYVIAPRDNSSDLLVKEGCVYNEVKLDNKGTNPFNDFVFYKELRKMYQRISPDFIFHYTIKPNIYGTYAAYSLQIPSIAVVSGAGHTFIKKNLINLLVKKMLKFAAQKSYQVWFLNQDDLSQFVSANIVVENKTKVLPSEGVNLAHFKRSRDYPMRSGDSMSLLLTARLLWDKGVGIYAEAASVLKAEFPNLRFGLLGFLDAKNPTAIAKEQIEKWHNDGLIHYYGSTDDVKSYLEDTDCYILPTYYREGVPRSVLEAASMSIPIITTNNVGCKDVVDDSVNGYLCEMKSVESLLEKIRDIISLDTTERKLMGEKGRKKVENEFDEKIVVKYYSATLKNYFN
jgi:glycosyltransferase involved in cell wall biosynthesis